MTSFQEVYYEFVREKMELLSSFPKISRVIYDAIHEKLEEYGVKGEVYFFGSIIKGTFTASSDIDIAIVVDHMPKQRLEIEDDVMRVLEGKGLPVWLPVEFHFMTPAKFEMLRKGGANLVKAEEYLETHKSASGQG
jgi:predicted nucleotidyltransferase